LVCDGEALRGSIVSTAAGASAFISQVTLYSAALELAIAQGCYAMCFLTSSFSDPQSWELLKGRAAPHGAWLQWPWRPQLPADPRNPARFLRDQGASGRDPQELS